MLCVYILYVLNKYVCVCVHMFLHAQVPEYILYMGSVGD